MKKFQKARTTVSVTVAGITGSSIVLIKDQIISSSRKTGLVATEAANNSLEKILLLFIILLAALFVTHFLFKLLTTQAFKIKLVRKLILRQDYVEGYWVVENSINGCRVSTGFMQYQIIDEQLKITGEHFLSFNGNEESETKLNSTSESADCYKGKYHNYFYMKEIGPGVAAGNFHPKGHGGGIPYSFKVEVVVKTTPDRIFEWGQNTPLWINDDKQAGYVRGFTSLLPKERKEIIDLMAKNKIVTMEQNGIRKSKKEVDKAEKENPKNYKRILVKEYFGT